MNFSLDLRIVLLSTLQDVFYSSLAYAQFWYFSNYQYSFCFFYWNILHDPGILTLDRIKSEQTTHTVQDTWLLPYSTMHRVVV
jgi:hypothetical protein